MAIYKSVFFSSIIALSAIFFSHYSSAAIEQTMLLYDFDDSSGAFDNAAEVLSPNLQAGAWFDHAATLTDFAGNPGRALAARGFDLDNAMTLVVNINDGASLSLSGFDFDQTASSSGPTRWQLSVNGLELANGETASSFTTESGALSLVGLSGELVIAVAATGASSSRGTFRLDNFTLRGNLQPVPIPAPAVLLLSSLMPLAWRLRR